MAVGYGLADSGVVVFGVVLGAIGFLLSLPITPSWIISLLSWIVYIPFVLLAMWQTHRFMNQNEISFIEWGIDRLPLVPWLIPIAIIWWFWRSGDPFKDRKLW